MLFAFAPAIINRIIVVVVVVLVVGMLFVVLCCVLSSPSLLCSIEGCRPDVRCIHFYRIHFQIVLNSLFYYELIKQISTKLLEKYNGEFRNIFKSYTILLNG